MTVFSKDGEFKENKANGVCYDVSKQRLNFGMYKDNKAYGMGFNMERTS